MSITLQLSRYPISELLQFVRNALMTVGQHNPDRLQIKSQYQALNKAYQQEVVSEINRSNRERCLAITSTKTRSTLTRL